ncbi:MAG: hypothetical protein OEV30_06275 [Ignavibacteria bacterium]|nr:hypothetical protein [Ignavibacteria bacterium]
MNCRIGFVFLLLGIISATGFGQRHTEDLGGMTFAGTVTGGGEEAIADTVLFVGCQFASKHFGKSGFPKACYVMTNTEEAIRFEVESVGKESGTVRWKGRVKGEEMEAIALVKNREGKTIEYEFHGRKLSAKGE